MGNKYLFIVAMLFCVTIAAPQAHAASIGIAAIVNDEIITTNDVVNRRDLLMALNGVPHSPEGEEAVGKRALQSLIDEQLQLQEAKRQSQIITDEDVDKAYSQMSRAGAEESPGSLKQFVRGNNLSEPSVRGQIKAQLAWQKVVQTKLRRNVSISQDEVLRAQTSEVNAPAGEELQMAALSIPVQSPADSAAASKLAQDIAQQLKQGADIRAVAAKYVPKGQVQFTPSSWVPEESLQPALQQAMRSLKPGEATPPLRSSNSYQIIQLQARQQAIKVADATEFALKQFSIAVPAKHDAASFAKLEQTASFVHDNPGSCDATAMPVTPLPVEVKFSRTQFGLLNAKQKIVLSHLQVGGISDPLPTSDSVQLVMLCERIEPVSKLPNADTIRQKLFAEKMELEAQKLLRNLRRDAFIDIKADDAK